MSRCNENNIFRKIIMVIMIIAITIMCGCNYSNKNNDDNIIMSYTQEEYMLPHDVNEINDIQVLENGEIAIAGINKDGNFFNYKLNKNNEEWLQEDVNLKLMCDKENIIMNNSITQNGIIINECICYNDINEDSLNIYISNSEGKGEEVNLLSGEYNDISKFVYDYNENIIIFTNSEEEVNIIDLKNESEEVRKIDLSTNNKIDAICFNDEYLFFYTSDEIIKMDKKSNQIIDKVDLSNELQDMVIELYRSNGDYIYAVTNKGLYTISNDNKITKVFDLSKILSTEFKLVKFKEINQDEYLMLFYDYEESKYILKKFKIQEDDIKLEKKTFTIYSLYENEIINQVIRKYSSENENVDIKYEIGIETMDSSKTVNDEIKNLNIDIVSGNGPDLIVLDDLPIKSYVDKGLLLNLNDISSQIIGGENLFNNFFEILKNNKSEIHFVPLRFALQSISAKEINDINNLNKLTEVIKTLDGKENIMDIYEPSDLVWLLYRSCGEDWIINENEIERNKLIEFLNSTKTIYNIIVNSISDEKLNKDYDKRERFGDALNGESYSSVNYYDRNNLDEILYSNGPRINISNITTIYDLSKIESIKKYRNDINYEFWNGQDTQFIIPVCSIGINSKSEAIDLASEFLIKCFNYDYQRVAQDCGLPVNLNVFRKNLSSDELETSESRYTIEGELIETTIKKLSEDEINILEKNIGQINRILVPDKLVLNQIIEYIEEYILDERTLDETLLNIENKLQLYLSE
ncbi:hypothetical protein [Clostridium sp. D43t1_170807_H7]|uniref:hypothetical protein n=1 Tax=Clostridium sp. D43t1_170807_H7 TaxID=2787140 RepID=UPI001898E676|nr:hypothetical protein [Clostridium sp. D43t1_170807_H7]